MRHAPKRLVLNLETLKRLDQGQASEVQGAELVSVKAIKCINKVEVPSVDIPCLDPFTFPCYPTVTGQNA